MAKTNIINLTSFIFEIGTLRKIARSHRQTLLTDDLSDNIASHSFRTTLIGFFLSIAEKADSDKVTKMCLFHDVGETRSNDSNWVHKKYIKVFEDEISKDQLSSLPNYSVINNLFSEYCERKTKEAKLAKDADLLDQLFILREYEWIGNKEAAKWLKGKAQDKMLFSKTAKKIAKELRNQNPSAWWDNHWTSKRR